VSRAPGIHWDSHEAWHLMLPPGRPSVDHLATFRRVINRASKFPRTVGILGSTPELRDLCARLGIMHVWVIDRNSRFHESMNRLRLLRAAPETVIIADWIDALTALVDTFDLLLSDLTLGNLPYERRRSFFRSVAASLKPGGLFVDRVLTNQAPAHLLADLDKKYRSLPYNLISINSFMHEYFFLSELTTSFREVNVRAFTEILQARWNETGDEALHIFLTDALQLTTPDAVWHYGKPWMQVAVDYAPELRRLETIPEKKQSLYYRRSAIFVSQKIPCP